jgi:hypothetical protein
MPGYDEAALESTNRYGLARKRGPRSTKRRLAEVARMTNYGAA